MSEQQTLSFSQPLTWSQSEHCLVVSAAEPLYTLSSALVGGGFGYRQHFANFHVDKDYDGHYPEDDLIRWLDNQRLPLCAVAMMTAVRLRNACVASVPLVNTANGVLALVTAGVGNAVDISVSSDSDPRLVLRSISKVGTINTFLFLDAHLTDGALVNASLSATEAKVQALRKVGVKDPFSDTPATGTSTDSLSIAATQRGCQTSYAGSGTALGRAIGQAVYRATLDSLSKSQQVSPC
ncbi:adenosylcobinamide amidohydrolase [Vreelandella venusta]|uniref:adenosylcobinamide amidohydrolase n=1 Tax=Vreelandella venusta TaxID=44935 RepID=UPI0018DACB2A|nr:adenosylcobinamide amidohydrolase [Halomonas venusta]QPI65502.1 adenosylcobinamide amidohydrolase [Halomonas venusta]WAM56936.1 adenosylcobinamide amidohydrolase [Halomonas venusta]